MRCTVKFLLNQVTCPGTLHLPDRNPVYLSIYLFGRFHRSQHVYPSFPMVFTSKIKFQRLFTNAKTPEQVLEILEDETILIELRQYTKGLKGGKVLAEFEETTRTFLFPTPSYIPRQDHLKRDVLLTRTESFPSGKCLDPKLSFRTKTYIEEGPYRESIHHIPVNRQIPPSEISPPSKPSQVSKSDCTAKKHAKRKKGKKKLQIVYPMDEEDAELHKSDESRNALLKKHCVCNCPTLLDDSFSIDYWLDKLNSSRIQRRSKVKAFRTGKDTKNLISKRQFSDAESKVKRSYRKGICKCCAVPLPTCVLCNAYKTVYGRDSFLIHRFKKRNRKSLNGHKGNSPDSDHQKDNVNSNSPKSPLNCVRVRDSHLLSKYSPPQEVLNYPSGGVSKVNKELLMIDGNHRKHISNTSYVPAKYATPEKHTDLIGNYEDGSNAIPPRASSQLSTSYPLAEGYRRAKTALLRQVKSPFSNSRASHHHSEEEFYELELERINKRIKELMVKNKSVLQNDLSSSDSISEDDDLEDVSSSLSSSFDDSPLEASSKRNMPYRSIVSPLQRYGKKRTQHLDDISHRDKLDSRLKAIYAELYEKTLSDL